jgi:hypothetical protein
MASVRQSPQGSKNLCDLGATTATARSDIAAATTATPAKTASWSTSGLEVASTGWATIEAAAATASAATGIKSTRHATLLDIDVFATDAMWIGLGGSLEAGESLILDESRFLPCH